MQVTRLVFALLFVALLFGICMSHPTKKGTARRHQVRLVDIDECSSDPCQNGAICVDGIDSFTCMCAPGFTGYLCETDIDECSSDPCQNGAICVDGIGSFTCMCAPGFTGYLCETGQSSSTPPPGTCGQYQIKCLYSDECVYFRELCDGKTDCIGGEDEDPVLSCGDGGSSVYPCSGFQASCIFSQECVYFSELCDGKRDCIGGEDENNERTCDPLGLPPQGNSSDGSYCDLQCPTGECFSAYMACDGHNDCADGFDEPEHICGPHPPHSTVQYPYDSSDRSCDNTQYQCSDGSCIDQGFLCDGVANCMYGDDEDENFCGGPPPNPIGDTFTCISTGDTIPQRYTCDRIVDCAYGEDEWLACGTLDGMRKRDPREKSLRTVRKVAELKRSLRK